MAEATNAQMQAFADQRIRVRAEQFRALYNSCKDDKTVIDDVYARASGTNRWDDARTDGPPHMLQSGNSATPDDVLNYNTFITAFIAFIETDQVSIWGVLADACVRPVNQ